MRREGASECPGHEASPSPSQTQLPPPSAPAAQTFSPGGPADQLRWQNNIKGDRLKPGQTLTY